MSRTPIKVWEGIEADEAEARLTNLRRRQSDLEGAFYHQQQIQKIHPDSFAVELSRQSLDARRSIILEELASILRHRVSEPIKLSLSGKEFHDHSASIGTLGLFLLRLQKLYSAVAQAIQTGPTLRGPIANALRQSTEMRLSYVYESSFGMELYVPSSADLMGGNVASESLNRMFQLFTASNSERGLMAESGALGGRVTNHLRYLASYLATSDSTINLTWLDYTGREHSWLATPSAMTGIVDHLKQIIQTSSAAKNFTGMLVGGSIFKNNFELLIVENNTLIEGGMISGLAPAMTKNFGRLCTITVDETELLDRGSGEKRVYYVLTAIKDEPSHSKQIPA